MNFEAATQDPTTAAYTAVATTLHTMAEIEPKTPKMLTQNYPMSKMHHQNPSLEPTIQMRPVHLYPK